ncbi:MAG: acyloxyacyl hydrolase [Bacteroidales bacterium]|nr:acyloxyacyl hydrolase [Bacteroidales bacterium]
MKTFLAIIFSFTSLILASQDNPFYLSVTPQYGVMARHRTSMRYIIRENAQVLEISLSRKVSGNKIWHAVHKNPYLGGGFYLADLGNPEIMGKAIAVYGFIKKPIFERKKISISYQVSTGVSYLTTPFDAKENYLNHAIGSSLNVYFFLGYDFRHKLTERFYLNHGIGFTHYSNGAWSKPNLGFNVIGLYTGVFYKLQNIEEKTIQTEIPEFNKSNEWDIYSSVGINEFSDGETRKYFVSSSSIDYLRHRSFKRKIGLGLDFFYSEALDNLNTSENEPKKIDRLRIGLHVSYEVVFGDAVFFANLGYYIHNQYPMYGGDLYDKVGLKWFVYKRLYAGLALKTHFAKAEFIEWGIGIGF